MNNLRDYIPDHLSIDGRLIPYRIFTASSYLLHRHGMSAEKIDDFSDKNHEFYHLLNQIIALKQSCFLLRHTSYSCGSLADDLFNLKKRLIKELDDNYAYEFDDDFVEQFGK